MLPIKADVSVLRFMLICLHLHASLLGKPAECIHALYQPGTGLFLWHWLVSLQREPTLNLRG